MGITNGSLKNKTNLEDRTYLLWKYAPLNKLKQTQLAIANELNPLYKKGLIKGFFSKLITNYEEACEELLSLDQKTIERIFSDKYPFLYLTLNTKDSDLMLKMKDKYQLEFFPNEESDS